MHIVSWTYYCLLQLASERQYSCHQQFFRSERGLYLRMEIVLNYEQ